MLSYERNEISIHEVRIFSVLSSKKWKSVRQVSEETKIPNRTVHTHLNRLVQLGIVDLAEVFPSHRFKISSLCWKRNKGYINRLVFASEVFDLPLPIKVPKAVKKTNYEK